MALTREERTGAKFVEMYEASLGDNPNLEEQLVLSYFKKNADDLPVDQPDPTSFHKAFRQVDICRKGYQDMVIWSLMSGGELNTIWKVLEEFYAN
ncbi:hypothetical protein phage621_00034 [Klebsiella phage vB_KpnM_Seu621]|uniref:Uncharacterized protein n=1 Tax=Klebsiella phage vB_KpnM_Seu621 TaxID=2776831 RepID=A0A7L8ZIQ9_9CAUD|nr:hypothetical protein phage621_00034 [Klebsiella phage vB_KpnM_Seu621]